MTMSQQQIPLSEFENTFARTTELSSCALGGQVVGVSDDFFAEAFHLLLVEPAPSLKGQFGPNGALFSGWESRRHNPAYDWCIIKLGTSGLIVGFDIDTAHFNGNEAPQVSVDALFSSSPEEPKNDNARWTEILPKANLGPSSRHLFKIPQTSSFSHVKLNMYPDGGIARFRVYGLVVPVHPTNLQATFDLAHVFAGGRVEFTSDQHFGVGSNLILPGRGKDMGDGWETKRSRRKDHKDWAIIRLGAPGVLEHAEIDTAHFKGNFPESCELHALYSLSDIDWQASHEDDQDWLTILPRSKLGPHRQHYFQLENVEGKIFTHVKVTIHPDGGIKRIRINGRKATTNSTNSASMSEGNLATPTLIPILPLTPEAFAPFGQVIQAYEDHAAAPKGIRITPANGGTASKFHKLSLLTSSYPVESGATSGISVYRCNPVEVGTDGTLGVQVLERHPFTNQAFIPTGRDQENLAYLVVVVKNGRDDRPDMQTLRAFVANASQGVVYEKGIWHQPMTVLGKVTDFACVETQIGDGGKEDCEILELDPAGGLFRLKLTI
ncbi:allantoicase [Infundibulicybe gibba]|nr:allantoicase [Infundibulicybe gibba]